LVALVGLGALVAVVVGCQRKAQQAAPTEPPKIQVSHPIEREVTDFTEYTGRTDAVDSVTVRPRVTGPLKAMPFKEGEEVRGPVKLLGATLRQGDLLFRVDAETYQATYDQAEGQLKLYQAQKQLAEAVYAQDKDGYNSGAVSIFQVNQDKANLEQAEARIKSAEATLRSARLNLSYCTIRAPISGRISRYYFTPGNLVSANSTNLTTIVSMDHMYAYFDVEEIIFKRLVTESATLAGVSVRMATEGDKGFPHRGKLNFINNQVNPSTGTIALRALFDNERTKSGMWRLLPGMFVRVRIDLGTPYKSTLIVDKAIGSDQGLKFVYVVDAEKKVQYRRVETGPLQEDGLRVIRPYKPKTETTPESGVKLDEWVVVTGLPQLRPRLEIRPDQIPMPTSDNDPTHRTGPKAPPPGGEKKGEKK
jgi:multidrug efflux system membrane fusion protein